MVGGLGRPPDAYGVVVKHSRRALLFVPLGAALILCVIMLLRPSEPNEAPEKVERLPSDPSGQAASVDAETPNEPPGATPVGPSVENQAPEGEVEPTDSLARLTPPEFSQVLAKLRRALSNGAVGPLAFRILSELPDPADRLRAIETILRDPSDTRSVGYHKSKALWMLGELGYPEGVPLALEALKVSDSQWLRKEAAEALGKLGDPSVSGVLHAAYLDAPLEVKKAIVSALKRLGDSTLLSRFLDDATTALSDLDAKVRRRAMGLLVNLDDPRTFPIAVRALRDKDDGVRMTATSVLRKMPSTEALPHWESALGDREDYVRYMAQRRIEEIIEAPGDELERDAKARAIRALGKFGDRQSLRWLRNLPNTLRPEDYLSMKGSIEQAIHSLDQRLKK